MKNPIVRAPSIASINKDERTVGQKVEAEFISIHGGTFLNGQYMTAAQCTEYAYNLGKTANKNGQPRSAKADDGLDELILNMQVTESLRIINTWLEGFDSYIGLDD